MINLTVKGTQGIYLAVVKPMLGTHEANGVDKDYSYTSTIDFRHVVSIVKHLNQMMRDGYCNVMPYVFVGPDDEGELGFTALITVGTVPQWVDSLRKMITDKAK